MRLESVYNSCIEQLNRKKATLSQTTSPSSFIYTADIPRQIIFKPTMCARTSSQRNVTSINASVIYEKKNAFFSHNELYIYIPSSIGRENSNFPGSSWHAHIHIYIYSVEWNSRHPRQNRRLKCLPSLLSWKPLVYNESGEASKEKEDVFIVRAICARSRASETRLL